MRFSEKENLRRHTFCAPPLALNPSTSLMVVHLTLTLTGCLPCQQLAVFWLSLAMWWKWCDKKDNLHNLIHAAAVHGLFLNSGASIHRRVTWAKQSSILITRIWHIFETHRIWIGNKLDGCLNYLNITLNSFTFLVLQPFLQPVPHPCPRSSQQWRCQHEWEGIWWLLLKTGEQQAYKVRNYSDLYSIYLHP